MDKRLLVGVTGASGAVYAERLVEVAMQLVPRIYLVITATGLQVIKHELKRKTSGFSLYDAAEGRLSDQAKPIIRICQNDDLFAPVASGSSAPTDMVVLPCSMGTLARVATGVSTNLLERAADVMLKQRRNLVVCPRETPLSAIHLRNMLSLAEMGVQIVPAMPAFYQKPESLNDMVDFVVGRVLETLSLEHKLYTPWNPRMV